GAGPLKCTGGAKSEAGVPGDIPGERSRCPVTSSLPEPATADRGNGQKPEKVFARSVGGGRRMPSGRAGGACLANRRGSCRREDDRGRFPGVLPLALLAPRLPKAGEVGVGGGSARLRRVRRGGGGHGLVSRLLFGSSRGRGQPLGSPPLGNWRHTKRE